MTERISSDNPSPRPDFVNMSREDLVVYMYRYIASVPTFTRMEVIRNLANLGYNVTLEELAIALAEINKRDRVVRSNQAKPVLKPEGHLVESAIREISVIPDFWTELMDERLNSHIKLAPTVEDVHSWLEQTRNGSRGISRVDLATIEMLNNLDKKIIYIDEDLIVIDKPPYVNSHYGLVNRIGLEEILRYKYGNEVKLAHRLDSETSGVIIASRNRNAFNSLTYQISHKSELDCKKLYICLMAGKFESNDIVPVTVYLSTVDGQRTKVVDKEDPYAKKSITLFDPISIYTTTSTESDTITLAAVQIVTGRKHQIRVVSADSLKKPIIGDRIYNPNFPKVNIASRQMLHAHSISFYHPKTDDRLTFVSRIPNDIEEVITQLSWMGYYK